MVLQALPTVPVTECAYRITVEQGKRSGDFQTMQLHDMAAPVRIQIPMSPNNEELVPGDTFIHKETSLESAVSKVDFSSLPYIPGKKLVSS
jgi:DMSO/TMAO reductase YedYZ molybdopterin-dependent catalytic subunit